MLRSFSRWFSLLFCHSFGSFDTRQVFKIYCYVFMLSFVLASSSCLLVPHTHSRMQTHHIQLKSKLKTEFIAQIWCRLAFVCRGVMAQVSPYSIQNNEIKRFVSSTRPNFVRFLFFFLSFFSVHSTDHFNYTYTKAPIISIPFWLLIPNQKKPTTTTKTPWLFLIENFVTQRYQWQQHNF